MLGFKLLFTLLRLSSLLLVVPAGLGFPLASETRSSEVVGVATLPFNFTLSAYNVTPPNSNQTGAPLVLGAAGATTGAELHVSSTYASYPYNDYPTLALIDGSLRAYDKNGNWYTNATQTLSGSPLSWLSTTLYTHDASTIYSAVTVPNANYPLLAVYGHHDLWSLCPYNGFRGQTSVVFNVTADIPPPPYLGFDPENCFEVILHIVSE